MRAPAPLRYLSVCSGIEAATVAWHPLGWQPVAFSEIEAFPSAVLAHHYPDVPNLGDMTKYKEWPDADIDALVGGTPCQSFSLAGLRAGLDDPRGNLALVYLGIADRYRPEWLVWENVPGVLSSTSHAAPDPCPPPPPLDMGRDGAEMETHDDYDSEEIHAFNTLLAAFSELGYGWAYRVLDTQYVRVDGFGRAVPQRRRRVIVVGCLGGWRGAAAVLFERESLSGNPPPRREAGQGLAGTLDAGLGTRSQPEGERDHLVVAHALRGEGFDASEDGTGRATPIVPIPFDTPQITSPTNRANPQAGGQVAVAFDLRGRDGGSQFEGPHDTVNIRAASGGSSRSYVVGDWEVRRVTPPECERLQAFPDDYTLVPYRGKPAADGPRYKALGNSMSVNVMRWVGQRIDMVRALPDIREAAE